MTKLRILLADDHEVVRRGTRVLLEEQSGWQVCGEARDGRQLVHMAKEMRPDVVVTDITMPYMDGLEASREVTEAAPKASVLILTMHEPDHFLREALEAGIRGYVLKSDAGRELVTAVRAMQMNLPYFSSSVLAAMTRVWKDNREASGQGEINHNGLTNREHEVAVLLAYGKSNKEVAAELGISVRTAEAHRANIMRKLGLHSISELVRFAIRNQIIRL